MKSLLVLLCAAGSARAVSLPGESNQALPCRPTISCTADLAVPGTVELELGYLFQRLAPPVLQHSVPFLLKVTLAKWAQLQIGGNGPVVAPGARPSSYFDNLDVGLKLRLREQSTRAPSVSWSVAAAFPVDSAPGYQRAYNLAWTGYLSKDLGRFHIDLNAGVTLWRLEGIPQIQPWVALAASVSLPRRFGLAVETYYFGPARPLSADDGGVRLVVTYSPRGFIVFDIGADAGWFPSQRAVSAFAGLTVVPVALW